MKRVLMTISALTLAAGVASAEGVAPGDAEYVDGALAMSLTGQPGDAEAGKKVMTTRGLGNCIACHAVTALNDFPFHGDVGPTLDGAGSRWEEAELRGIVANSKMMFEGSMMPSFYKKAGYIRPGNGYTGKGAAEADLNTLLTAQQVEDVVAYLLTLTDE